MQGPGGRNYGAVQNGVMSAAAANLNVQTAFSKSGIFSKDMEDPMLARGNALLSRTHSPEALAQESALKVVRTTVLATLPPVFFCASLGFTIWASGSEYPIEYGAVYLVCVIVLIFYGTAVVRSQGRKTTISMWRRWTGRLCHVAAIIGMVVGGYLFYTHFIFYRAYLGMNTYTNIAVSQPVEQFVDAAMIAFTSQTTLDVTRAVGFKSATANAMLCVAPIVDGTMGFEQDVNYFAVGINCCEPRSSFLCDDASDTSTKNVLMMLEPHQVTSPLMEWAVAGALDRSGFDAAIRMQTAAYQTVAASKTRLVYWTKDPTAYAHQYYKKGLESAIIAMVIYFFASVFAAWFHMYAPKWLVCE